jgi:RHS repeat-associated protein
MIPTQADLFSYKLDYETAGYFDGNIGKQTWKVCDTERSYTYTYDAASRLTGANYQGKPTENYSLSNMAYDRNGNILSLSRKGKNGNLLNTDIDQLTYDYTGTGNRLKFVNDAIMGNENVGDFRNNNTGDNDYAYWPNGNLKADLNEGITNINYDTYLNQPSQITLTGGRSIIYQYDGAGRPLKTTYSNNETWDNTGGMMYKNNKPYQIQTAEGRIIAPPSGAGGPWTYEYDYKDHLGNTRLSYRDKNGQLTKTAETHYDPWGITLQGIGQKNNPANRWELQGKEKESTFGLNRIMFGARTYNPTIGKFDGVDTYAEMYDFSSPFNYTLNKPLSFVDLNGNESTDVNQEAGSGMVPGALQDPGKGSGRVPGAPEATKEQPKNSNDDPIKPSLNIRSILSDNTRVEVYRKTIMSENIPKYQENRSYIRAADTPEEHFQKYDPSAPLINSINTGQLIGAIGTASVKTATILTAKILAKKAPQAAMGLGRIQAGSLKEFKSLVQQLSKPGSNLTKTELQQFEKLTEQFGGKLRYDLNPVKGKILQPHVQVEGLGTSVGSRHIWLGQ